MFLGRALLPALALLGNLVVNAGQANRLPAAVLENAPLVTLAHHVSARLASAQDLGQADESLRLDSLVLLLKPSTAQKQALEELLIELQNPSSPQYRHWLTSSEYADRFGLSEADIEKTRAWLESKGLHVDQVANGRNWIMFSGTQGQVANAFHTQIHRFQADSAVHYANISDPEIPGSLADVVAGIHGLTDFHPRAANRQSLIPHYLGNGSTYLGPADVAIAYNIKPLYAAGYKGSGVSIAVVGQTDFTMSDITAYRNFFGLPANQPQIVLAGADPGTTSSDDVAEAELDLELAGGIAPNASIKFVNSRDVMTSALYAIDNDVAPIITMSYGACEQESTVNLDTWRGYVQQANAKGITFLAASGDAGAFACDWNPASPSATATHGIAVNFPASIPEVTAVGGTQLTVNHGSNAADKSNISVNSEQAWNESDQVSFSASGGGPSQHFTKPAWQNVPGIPADGYRDLPDIALSAAHWIQDNPYAICFHGSCQSGSVVAFGGTSAASPVAAGILAVLTQYQLATSGIASLGLGNINPRLYQLSQNSPAAILDVTKGSTSIECQGGTAGCVTSPFGYSAGVGYDLATGLGSLNAYELATAWSYSTTRSAATLTVSSVVSQCSPGVSFVSSRVLAANGVSMPTGSVYFYNIDFQALSVVFLGSAPVSANGTASLKSATTVTNGTLEAIYTGDAQFLGTSSKATVTNTGSPVGPLTAQISSQSVLQGTPLQIVAHVDLVCGPVSGQITFADQFGYLLFATPDASGNALFVSSGLSFGIHEFYVAYSENNSNLEGPYTFRASVVNPATPRYTLSLFAGTGVPGVSGDGGPATAAQLNGVNGIAIDQAGNTYLADTTCGCIRKVNSAGVITTVASGFASSLGPLAVGPSGIIYAAGPGSQVSKLVGGMLIPVAGSGVCSTYSGEAGPALRAVICPDSEAIDGQGNLYIADSYNFRVYKVTPSGTISTVAGGASSAYASPADGLLATAVNIDPVALTVDNQGNLLVVHSNYNVLSSILFKITSDGILHTIAGNVDGELNAGYGPALSQVIFPRSIAVDRNGNIFFSEQSQIFEISGGIVYLIAGNGVSGMQSSDNAIEGELAGPAPLALDSAGNLYAPGLAAVQILQPYSNTLNTALRFVPVTPCRLADTRLNTPVFGGMLTTKSTRDFLIPQSSCGIPTTAQAYSLNVTAVPKGLLSYVTLWPTHQPQPFVSLLNSDGRVKANAAIARAGDGGGVSVYSTDDTDVIIDINGYFEPATNASALAFYPLTPCRIADTRSPNGSLGGPSLIAGQARSFPVLSSPCGLPANVQAYSLNFTVVPRVSLGYLSTWPAGQSQPGVSTLNAGHAVVANAAIVPAGSNGAIMVYASDATDVIIDVNGYFAPPSANGLSLFTTAPCRPVDTRMVATGAPFLGTTTADLAGSSCGVPASAKAFVLNATVVPPGDFSYLTLWPNGQAQPVASTLNAVDGAITSNMAVVPATNGVINAFGTDPVQLILDLSGYFAP